MDVAATHRVSWGTWEMVSLVGMGINGVLPPICNIVMFMVVGQPKVYPALQNLTL